MQFRLHPLRFSFLARESIHFPEGKSANILRGAFGTIFRRIVCVPQCTGVQCEWRASCPYARVFEPSATGPGPSGLADWPRPFVFRAMHLDGSTFAAGSQFYFDLNLFDTETPAIAYLVATFAQLAREGLGPGRRKVELTSVTLLSELGDPSATIYENGSMTVRQNIRPLELNLSSIEVPITRLRVQFVTPTELKSGQQITATPEFGILAARARDRIGTLRELYGGGPLDIDFRGFGQRAAAVRMTRCEIRGVDLMRRSSRTGQVYPIGGFVGEADYEGELAEFVPYLRAAKWTGVGRQTVWGKGEISLHA
ncbi:MAG TPA: CRISPR system precrRNA processing endoribonuclease RAMP protein Cas6 [Bryobacteraceae bacterium]|nr:CRISPR system precrRNA processing endoribonuclease RAMP protein Cas6 [Bryobacteraceae bacterium]